jgi:hypothetical protein
MQTNPQVSTRIAALLRAPMDSWIALSDDETTLVAHGATYQEVVDELDRIGDESSVILKTPPTWFPMAV